MSADNPGEEKFSVSTGHNRWSILINRLAVDNKTQFVVAGTRQRFEPRLLRLKLGRHRIPSMRRRPLAVCRFAARKA
jgi:hypothetical protein